MKTSTTMGLQVGGRLHLLLLRLAGRVPDDLIAETRRWLAAGQRVDVAQALAFGVIASAVPLEPDDIDLLSSVLTEDGAGTEILDDIRRGGRDGYPPYTMAPVAPDVLADRGDAVPSSLDLTGAYPTLWGADPIDEAAMAATGTAAGEFRLVGLWRAWRYPASESPWPAPKRVYLVEAGAEIAPELLPTIADAIQAALIAVGERDPQVEVVVAGGDEPTYQAWVRGYGALLWSAAPTEPLRVARAFDRVDPTTGPAFDPDHPHLPDGERAAILAYLNAGESVLATGTRLPDLFDSERGEVVPLNLRTDGEWIWAETTSYYLEQYGIAPDPDLLDHIRNHITETPAITSVDLHLALVALENSGQDLVWAS